MEDPWSLQRGAKLWLYWPVLDLSEKKKASAFYLSIFIYFYYDTTAQPAYFNTADGGHDISFLLPLLLTGKYF